MPITWGATGRARAQGITRIESQRSIVKPASRIAPAVSPVRPAIAARSFAGVSDAEREDDLMHDQTAIDESEHARAHAIESYLQALGKQIDDAE